LPPFFFLARGERGFGAVVERGGGFVKQQIVRRCQDSADDAETLLLSPRQVYAALRQIARPAVTIRRTPEANRELFLTGLATFPDAQLLRRAVSRRSAWLVPAPSTS
jgi:hypothetical protein